MLRQEVQDLHASLKVSMSLKQGEMFSSIFSWLVEMPDVPCFHLIRRNDGSLES